jgi:two-component system sensor histidine kinase BaeS
MTDPADIRPARRAVADTLRTRLAVSFLGVALAAVALLAVLTVIFASDDVSTLVHNQRTELTNGIAGAAAAGWERRDRWAGADLSAALDLAADTGSEVRITDDVGRVVEISPGFASSAGRPQYQAPVFGDGRPVGEVTVRFTGERLSGADSALQSALIWAIVAAAGVAALLALLTGLAVARRLTRPVRHIISVTRAMGAGVRTARVGPVRAPEELRELATAFDQMADVLDRQEQLRRDLVADVAHELRTPVAILQAGHEALLDGLAEPTPAELVSLHDEVLRLARMVDELETLAAADAAALHLELRPCDLAEVASSAADGLASRFGAAGVQLERRLAPAVVMADEQRLRQVVTNLLTNALKFSPGGAPIAIDVGPAGPDAILRVSDHGVGIPAADLPRIFDRFWRGAQAAQTSGSGIGLAIAAELVRAHHGHLSASSQPGAGTQMTLTLPLVTAA